MLSIAGEVHHILHYYGCYDPLQYPLLFHFDSSDWHVGIRKISTRTAGLGNANDVSGIYSGANVRFATNPESILHAKESSTCILM